MVVLFQRDVLPFYRAQEPPTSPIPPGSSQVAIHTNEGVRLGTAWLTTTPLLENTTVHSTIHLDLRALSTFLRMGGDLFFDTDLTYSNKVGLSEFQFRLETGLVSALVEGRRYGDQFACVAKMGSITRTMSFDGELSRFLGDSIRPFTHLSNLHVGQTWRLRVIDPIKMLTGQSLEFTAQLVKVTGQEMIKHRGTEVECFRIETKGATAWADDSGRVLRQEATVPLMGQWVMTAEPYDAESRKAAKREITQMRQGRSSLNSSPVSGATETGPSAHILEN